MGSLNRSHGEYVATNTNQRQKRASLKFAQSVFESLSFSYPIPMIYSNIYIHTCVRLYVRRRRKFLTKRSEFEVVAYIFFFFCVVSCVQFIPPSVLHFNRPRRLFHIFLFIHWWRCNGNESAAANVQSPKWWCDVGQTEGKLICDKLGTFFHVCPVRSIRWCGQHLATAAFAYVCTYNGGY